VASQPDFTTEFSDTTEKLAQASANAPQAKGSPVHIAAY